MFGVGCRVRCRKESSSSIVSQDGRGVVDLLVHAGLREECNAVLFKGVVTFLMYDEDAAFTRRP